MNELRPTLENDAADPLDQLLMASLSARPEPEQVQNLAARAMEHAKLLDRAAEQQRRTLLIHRWRLRFIYTAAAMLICSLVCIGGHRLLVEQSAMSSTDDSTTSTSTESYTPSTSTYVLWLGGVLFICTLAGLATESAIAPGPRAMMV
jgi:hypothetical protein